MKNDDIYSMRLGISKIAEKLYECYDTEGMNRAIEFAEIMLDRKKEYLALCKMAYAKELNGKKRPTELKRAQTKINECNDIIRILKEFIVGNKKDDTKIR